MDSKKCVKALVRGKTFPLGGAGEGGGAYAGVKWGFYRYLILHFLDF